MRVSLYATGVIAVILVGVAISTNGMRATVDASIPNVTLFIDVDYLRSRIKIDDLPAADPVDAFL